MLVKKFEAKTMKEALEMIKKEFGPEAIILSVKDNGQRFGLLGQGSVEVTAAVSEVSLQKKKFVENKIPDYLKDKYQEQPAKIQKNWVDQLINSYEKKRNNNLEKQKIIQALKERKYIDIPDDFDFDDPDIKPYLEKNLNSSVRQNEKYHEMIDKPQDIQKSQIIEKKEVTEEKTKNQKKIVSEIKNKVLDHSSAKNHDENIDVLKKEIVELKNMLQEMKNHSDNLIKEEKFSFPEPLNVIFKKMKNSGLREEFAMNLIDKVRKSISSEKQNKTVFIEGFLLDYILKNTQMIYPQEKIQIFMGPFGSGKTSLLVKWATFLKMRERKKIAIINCDPKIGAAQNLKTLSQILNVPFVNIVGEPNWHYILNELNYCDHILCDFPAISMKNHSEIAFFHGLLPQYESVSKHLVLNLTFDRSDLIQIVSSYKKLGINSLSFTHLDETNYRGFIYEIYELHKVPIFAISFGYQIPDHFELLSGERLVDFVFQISRDGGITLHDKA